MTLEEVQNYFGTMYQATKALGLSPQASTQWRRKGYIPLLQQYRVAELTEGELMPDEINPAHLYRKETN